MTSSAKNDPLASSGNVYVPSTITASLMSVTRAVGVNVIVPDAGTPLSVRYDPVTNLVTTSSDQYTRAPFRAASERHSRVL